MKKNKYKRKSFLITGGTGSLGSALIKYLLKKQDVGEVIVYARDEYKESEMIRKINNNRVKYWLGDVRDLERLKEACSGVDIIIHCAALKRMDNSSHNTFEVADVNIKGTRNVAIAGKKCKNVVLISTDKAYSPSCVYGFSKAIAEKIILAIPNGSVIRFGNFIDSRGSVFEIFKEQKDAGIPLTITNPNATRFIIKIEDACKFIMTHLLPGLHYPKNLKSMTVGDIAKSIAPDSEWNIVGLKPNEKISESFDKNYNSQVEYEKR